jgi:hypothetical protein
VRVQIAVFRHPHALAGSSGSRARFVLVISIAVLVLSIAVLVLSIAVLVLVLVLLLDSILGNRCCSRNQPSERRSDSRQSRFHPKVRFPICGVPPVDRFRSSSWRSGTRRRCVRSRGNKHRGAAGRKQVAVLPLLPSTRTITGLRPWYEYDLPDVWTTGVGGVPRVDVFYAPHSRPPI